MDRKEQLVHYAALRSEAVILLVIVVLVAGKPRGGVD